MRSAFARAVTSQFKSPLLLSAAAAVLLAGCSGSVDRFSDSSSEKDPVYTASVPKSVQGEGGISRDEEAVASRPLDDSSSRPRQTYASNGYNYQQAYKPPSYKQTPQKPSYAEAAPEPLDAEPAQEAPRRPASAGTVRVESGMTLYSIARSNGMSVRQLAAANDIQAPYAVHVGQTLRIPGTTTAVAPEPALRAGSKQAAIEPTYASPKQKITAGGTHTVKSGETLFSLGRSYGMSPYRIAEANGLSRNVSLKLGQTVKIPGGGRQPAPAVADAQPEPGKPAKAIDRLEPESPGQPKDIAAGEQPKAQQQAEAVPQMEPPAQQLQGEGPAAEAGSLSFRWPVKGRVISAYGSKPNGLRNEGVNISVPEGTGVRAAETGVVAYAGNELKGYGNLILIRHEGGWVTAYAHNKELFVKRGDAVKRGDVVAKAGQTGTVTSPQVHFEIRKGATAMDPMRFLNGTTASN